MTTTRLFGKAIKRKEDPALIAGTGRYVEDVRLPGELSAVFVRSPYARAGVNSIDTSAALEMPGVHAVYTIEDVRHLGSLLAQVPVGTLKPLLADGQIRHVGEAVAMVVGDDKYLARDAADAVEVDYDPMDAAVDLEDAATDRITVHDASNVIHTWEAGDSDGCAEAFGRDDVVVVERKMVNQRLIPVPIEPRAVLAEWNPGYGRVSLWSTTQIPHALAGAIATTFGLDANDVRVIAPEVGGGFGCKLNVYPDEILCTFASKMLGSPVRWTETRREAAVSTIQGRGWVATAKIAATREGDIVAYELAGFADMGAYSQNFTIAIPVLGQFTAPGQYDIPNVHFKIDCVYTNTPPTDAYRGAGRPEAAYYLERSVDALAADLDMDPADLRRRNYVKPEDFPFTTKVGMVMDSGQYAATLDRLLEMADIQGLRAEQTEAREKGRYLGIGLTTYVENCGLAPSAMFEGGFSWAGYGLPSAFNESATVRANPDGSVTVVTGTGPTGQGHETTWAQIASDTLGVPFDRVKVRHGDTHDSPMGIGTFGSRSAAVGGPAVARAAGRVQEKAARIAAHMLEAAAEDIRFEDGKAFVAGSPEQSVDWDNLVATAYQQYQLPEGVEAGLEDVAFFDPTNATWPYGAHMAVVEVDPETGDVELLRYLAVDDCGTVINPMIVAGQVQGGIAQGIGQAMFEEAVYDEQGSLLTSSLADYPIPTAADMPSFEMDMTVTPTDANPLGVKGIGEAGTIGSAQTIVAAVLDALRPLGVETIDMPLRPKRVWQAIQDVGQGGEG